MKHLTEVFDGKEPRVLLLGLDGAGRFSFIHSI